MDWEDYYLTTKSYLLHDIYEIEMNYPITHIIGIEAIIPYNHDEAVVVNSISYELPASGKPADVILDNSTFMRSKKVDWMQAELIYQNARTNEFFTKLTDIYNNSYDVEMELLKNDFTGKSAYAFNFITYTKVNTDNIDKAMDLFYNLY